jgi:hypothetical protein
LYKQLLRVVGEDNIRTTKGIHESIEVEDEWASLIIGQCVLDELRIVPKASSEISRVLRIGGTALLSGPVSRNGRLKFERQGKPPMVFLSLKEVRTELFQHRLRLLQTHDLTKEVKTALSQRGHGGSILDFEQSMDYVLVKATKIG